MQGREIEFLMVEDATDDPVLTVVVRTPMGDITVMADAMTVGNTLTLTNAHIGGALINHIGAVNLRLLGREAVERFGYDEIRFEGAVRTSGANPGRRPRGWTFRRRHRAPAD